MTDQDKTLGLIVCSLALAVIAIAALFAVTTDSHRAMEAILMAVSWWFGATMVWVGGKYYRAHKGN